MFPNFLLKEFLAYYRLEDTFIFPNCVKKPKAKKITQNIFMNYRHPAKQADKLSELPITSWGTIHTTQ